MTGAPSVADGRGATAIASGVRFEDLARTFARPPVVGMVSYDASQPSFRLRMHALRPLLEREGVIARTIEFGRKREWIRIARNARQMRSCDLLIFQQVKLLCGERGLVRRMCPVWALDVDDAVMYSRPRAAGRPASTAAWRQRRFRKMAAQCGVVVAGSDTLRRMVEAASRRVEVLRTPVDLAAYPPAPLPERERIRLAWIGLGGNLDYLEQVAPVLHRLRADGAEIELRVISDRSPAIRGVPTVLLRWSAAAEGNALAECDIGLAPLPDDPWHRGKAGFRCIQYAAAGLPTVTSPVGANAEIVGNGETGIWARSLEEWHAALTRLHGDVALRRRMGAAARRRAREYGLEPYARRYANLIAGLLSVGTSRVRV